VRQRVSVQRGRNEDKVFDERLQRDNGYKTKR
jgi:hypothetical protein